MRPDDMMSNAAGGRDDSGLIAYATVLALHRIAVDPNQLRHSVGHDLAVDADDLRRIAKRQDDVRAKSVRSTWDKLSRTPLPALANGPSGWFIIARVSGEEALIQPPCWSSDGVQPQVIKIERAALEAMWSGELLLVTTREGIGGVTRAFDVSWFIPQIVKYRRLIGEVLLVTLAINLLGLASPLFFQNVIDKVLVHNTLDTLTILVIGFGVVSIWETLFGWLRTRLYSETSQKIDVELGAKLFRHLLGLNLSYFEARRVGDVAMRVRQLETIREFLTNASLSVLVDPLFTVVFLVVMWFYSAKLFVIAVLAIPCYVAVAIFITGPLRARIEEKFERSAANNALLIEGIGGIQTVPIVIVWRETAMPLRIKCLSLLALGLASCGNPGPAKGGEANPLMIAEQENGPRPLAPNRLLFVHVEFGPDNSGSNRTYIRTEAMDGPAESIFRNLAFPSGLTTLSHNLAYGQKMQNFPQFHVTSSMVRFTSTETLAAQMRILNGTRAPDKVRIENGKRVITDDDLSGYEKIRTGYPEAYIYLFPQSADYEQALSGLDTNGIEGLDKFSAIGRDCAYARMSLDGGNTQAAIMLMRTHGKPIDLNDQEGQRCMLGFFARNWNISIESARRLVFGDAAVSEGRCEYARILQPGEDDRSTPIERSGCPHRITASKLDAGIADRQPEAVVAYARRKGIGLSPDEAQRSIAAMQRMCKDSEHALPDFKASCRTAFEGY